MNPMWSVWYIWFILFLVILPAQRRKKRRMNLIRRKRKTKMTNELVKKYIGQKVSIVSDNYSATGTVVSVEDNWVSLEVKNGNEKLINLDYVYRIDLVKDKK